MTSRVYLALCYGWMALDNTQRPPSWAEQVDDRYSTLKLEVNVPPWWPQHYALFYSYNMHPVLRQNWPQIESIYVGDVAIPSSHMQPSARRNDSSVMFRIYVRCVLSVRYVKIRNARTFGFINLAVLFAGVQKQTSSVCWAQLSRFHLKTDIESSLRKILF
jgi:hypothetical protein